MVLFRTMQDSRTLNNSYGDTFNGLTFCTTNILTLHWKQSTEYQTTVMCYTYIVKGLFPKTVLLQPTVGKKFPTDPSVLSFHVISYWVGIFFLPESTHLLTL